MRLWLEKWKSPIGTILLVSDGDAIRALDFEDFTPRFKAMLERCYGDAEIVESKPPRQMTDPLRAYFDGDLRALDKLPTSAAGTDFQHKVWTALRTIPAGSTWSYGELAKHIGNAKAQRAVGFANGNNPIAIVVPCHRVIGANGTLTGYGAGIERKRWLLRHEGVLL